LRGGEVRSFGIIANRADQITKLVGKLSKDGWQASLFAKPALAVMACISN